MTDFTDDFPTLPGVAARRLLEELAAWGRTTTVIVQGGCVFEFKGPFPAGTTGEGFYNLAPNPMGFEGHVDLGAISAIELQSRLHRGRPSHAFAFIGSNGKAIFKVFLGREPSDDLIESQLIRFNAIAARQSLGLPAGVEK